MKSQSYELRMQNYPTSYNHKQQHRIMNLIPKQKALQDQEVANAKNIYSNSEINERHRHRWEFNNKYRKQIEESGMVVSGVSPDNELVEIVEIPTHPWFVGQRT